MERSGQLLPLPNPEDHSGSEEFSLEKVAEEHIVGFILGRVEASQEELIKDIYATGKHPGVLMRDVSMKVRLGADSDNTNRYDNEFISAAQIVAQDEKYMRSFSER